MYLSFLLVRIKFDLHKLFFCRSHLFFYNTKSPTLLESLVISDRNYSEIIINITKIQLFVNLSDIQGHFYGASPIKLFLRLHIITGCTSTAEKQNFQLRHSKEKSDRSYLLLNLVITQETVDYLQTAGIKGFKQVGSASDMLVVICYVGMHYQRRWDIGTNAGKRRFNVFVIMRMGIGRSVHFLGLHFVE